MKKNPVNELVVLSNPRRRRSHSRKSYRRNPSMRGVFGSVLPIVKEGAIGAAGGIANDALYGFAKKWLPESMQTGLARTATKLGFAVALGVIANKVGLGVGKAAAVGAATVTIHEALTGLVNQQLPSLPLGAYEDNLLGFDSVGAYMASPAQSAQKVGAYMNGYSGGAPDLLPQ